MVILKPELSRMFLPEIKSELFKFQYLPDFAKFLLNNKLDEFGIIGIRFCREADLPMMRPLAKMPEKKLMELSRQANSELLTALSENDIVPYIEKNIRNFVTNQIKDKEGNTLLDRSEIIADDVILAFYLRRKTFAFFFHSYTQNAVVHALLAAEIDFFTSQEHLLTVRALIRSGVYNPTGQPGS
jgi:hypothetical protein